MTKSDASDDTRREARALGGYGCTLAGFFLLGSIVLAFRRPAVGIPFAIVAALIAGWIARKESAVAAATDDRRRALGLPVGDSWRRLFELEGLGDVIEEVARHVRGAARVSTRTVDSLATGCSRIGGTPDLAPGMTWPRRAGVPLAFLAQFDLSEVALVIRESPSRRRGTSGSSTT